MRRNAYRPATRGAFVPAGADRDLVARCRAIRCMLPRDAVFSHYTAARLRGWALPWLPTWLPDFASVPGGGTHVSRRGVYVARTDEALTGYEMRSGLPVLPAPAILAQLAQQLSLLDLVATLDSALHLGDCTVAELEASIRPYQHGGSRLRRALACADGRAESWWETPLRLLHMWCGIDVEPQYEVFDSAGNLVARADLWLVGTRRLHEYDGAWHDEAEARPLNVGRDRALGRIGWTRFGYVAADLTGNPRGILADADAAVGRPHRPERLRRWRAEAVGSTLSPRGRAALARRLRRYERS